MNYDAWRQHIQQFKDLLRLPVPEAGARAECKQQIEALDRDIPDLLFEGYRDWFDQDDDWLLMNLGQVLTAEQDAELLRLLSEGNGSGLIGYLSSTCVSEWRAQAYAAQAPSVRPNGGGTGDTDLTGTENTVNWAASRTPGTFYYAYNGREYVYSDSGQGPAREWKTLQEREAAATAGALAWGTGWCTPTRGDARYGGDYVFSGNREGPWLARAEAERLLGSEGATAAPWGTVWVKNEGGTWRYGLTEQGPWVYTDGSTAVAEREIVEQVTERLRERYPDADLSYVRAMAARYVAETAGKGG